MPRITSVDGFEDVCEQAERLRAAPEEVAVGDDSFEALDQREETLRELWRLGASRATLHAWPRLPLRRSPRPWRP